VRDVRVDIEGLAVGRLRVDDVRILVPEVAGIFTTPTVVGPLAVEIVVTDGDVAAWLREVAPAFARPTLRFDDGQVIVSDERVPFDLRIAVESTADGLRLVPAAGDRRLWTWLDLGLDVPVPDSLAISEVTIGGGEARVQGQAELEVDLDRRLVCP
jgi:hypothetical protein